MRRIYTLFWTLSFLLILSSRALANLPLCSYLLRADAEIARAFNSEFFSKFPPTLDPDDPLMEEVRKSLSQGVDLIQSREVWAAESKSAHIVQGAGGQRYFLKEIRTHREFLLRAARFQNFLNEFGLGPSARIVELDSRQFLLLDYVEGVSPKDLEMSMAGKINDKKVDQDLRNYLNIPVDSPLSRKEVGLRFVRLVLKYKKELLEELKAIGRLLEIHGILGSDFQVMILPQEGRPPRIQVIDTGFFTFADYSIDTTFLMRSLEKLLEHDQGFQGEEND